VKHALNLLAAASVLAIAAPASAALVVNDSTIGQTVIVQSTDDVIARYVSQTARLSSNLFLDGRAGVIFNNQTTPVGTTVNLGSFAVGTELVFRIEITDNGNIFRTGPASRNPDNRFHAASNTDAGETFVGFEDVLGGGDRDYDDLVFAFTNVAAAPGVPEPATWGLMLVGFGMVGAGLRTRRRSVTFANA